MQIALEKIVIDETIYPRTSLDQFHISRLRQALAMGAVFPPLVVEATTLRLVDGRNRLEAYRQAGIKTTDTIEKTYTSDADLFADAVRLNTEHGKPLDHFEIRSAVAKLAAFGFTRERISEAVRVPPERVDQIRKGFAHAPTGEAMALKGGLSHMRGGALTERQVTVNRSYGGAKGVFYANQIVQLLENDLWPRESDAFAEAMDHLTDLWMQQRKRRKKRAAKSAA